MHRERNGAEKHSISIMELIRCRKIVTKYEHTQSSTRNFIQFIDSFSITLVLLVSKIASNSIEILFEKNEKRASLLYLFHLINVFSSNSECFCRLNRIQKE